MYPFKNFYFSYTNDTLRTVKSFCKSNKRCETAIPI